jgi:UDP-N-acetylglucosamine kinase
MSSLATEGGDALEVSAYEVDRLRLLKEVVRQQLVQAQQHPNPTAIFTGGQPGAGKSTAIVLPAQEEFSNSSGIAVVDPDEVREMFPAAQLEMRNGGGTFSSDALNAAGTLAYQVCLELRAHRVNFVHEGTLSNLDYPLKEMKILRESGYRLEARFAAVDPNLSFARTLRRSELASQFDLHGFGRFVSKAVHDLMAARVPDSADELYNLKAVDRIAIFGLDRKPLADFHLRGGDWDATYHSAAYDGMCPGDVIRSIHRAPDLEARLAALVEWLAADRLSRRLARHPNASQETLKMFAEGCAAEVRLLESDDELRRRLATEPQAAQDLANYRQA